jgi:hypothetical protein
MPNTFSVSSLLGLQGLIWPLVQMVTGKDIPRDVVAPRADELRDIESVLRATADLVRVCAAAIDDGSVTQNEIDLVIAEAAHPRDAVNALIALVRSRIRHGVNEPQPIFPPVDVEPQARVFTDIEREPGT